MLIIELSRFNINQDWKEPIERLLFNVKLDLTFHNIEIAFAVKGDWFGNRETISSITVEYILERNVFMICFLMNYKTCEVERGTSPNEVPLFAYNLYPLILWCQW